MLSIIFDVDGTLLDTQRIFIPAWDYAGGLQGIEGMGAHLPNACGMSDSGCIAYLEDNFPTLNVPAFRAVVHDYITQNRVLRWKAGATELLAFLKSQGVKVALASGTNLSSVRRYFEKLDALHLFDVIVGGDEVENGKPAPDIFLLAAERLGVSPRDCIVFEDSKGGVTAAHSAGMRVVGVPDVSPFSDQIKGLLLAEFESLTQAQPYIENLIFGGHNND